MSPRVTNKVELPEPLLQWLADSLAQLEQAIVLYAESLLHMILTLERLPLTVEPPSNTVPACFSPDLESSLLKLHQAQSMSLRLLHLLHTRCNSRSDYMLPSPSRAHLTRILRKCVDAPQASGVFSLRLYPLFCKLDHYYKQKEEMLRPPYRSSPPPPLLYTKLLPTSIPHASQSGISSAK